MAEEKFMCNEAEVVKIVQNTMFPQIQEVKYSVDTLGRKMDYVIDDAKKEREQLKIDLAEALAELKLMKKLLYGNGSDKLGLVARLENHDAWILDMKRFFNVIIGALVVQIIGFLVIIGQHVLAGQ